MLTTESSTCRVCGSAFAYIAQRGQRPTMCSAECRRRRHADVSRESYNRRTDRWQRLEADFDAAVAARTLQLLSAAADVVR